jgi:hypothetical protein
MAALLRDLKSSCLHQTRQMLARRGCRDARIGGKLPSGPKASVQKVDTKGNPGIVREQSGGGSNSRYAKLASHADHYRPAATVALLWCTLRRTPNLRASTR